MFDLARRVRGLPIAVAALVISASVVFAGAPDSMPEAAADGLDTAADAAGKVVPVVPDVETPAEDAAPTVDDRADEERPDTHGATVSEAAQMETPEGFDTHGQFVSCVARMPHGADAPDVDLSTVTPASCAPADDTEGADAATPSKAQARGASGARGQGAERSAAARANAGG